jgi:hypothetical protein
MFLGFQVKKSLLSKPVKEFHESVGASAVSVMGNIISHQLTDFHHSANSSDLRPFQSCTLVS